MTASIVIAEYDLLALSPVPPFCMLRWIFWHWCWQNLLIHPESIPDAQITSFVIGIVPHTRLNDTQLPSIGRRCRGQGSQGGWLHPGAQGPERIRTRYLRRCQCLLLLLLTLLGLLLVLLLLLRLTLLLLHLLLLLLWVPLLLLILLLLLLIPGIPLRLTVPFCLPKRRSS